MPAEAENSILLDIPEELAGFATEYRFDYEGKTYLITRYDNHSGLIPDGRWVVMNGTDMNPHYLCADGTWVYKHGTAFSTPAAALRHLKGHPRD